MDAAGVEQDALRQRGLPAVDVRADADVADVAQLVAIGRRCVLLQRQRRKVSARMGCIHALYVQLSQQVVRSCKSANSCD